jgi:hypothetical protein
VEEFAGACAVVSPRRLAWPQARQPDEAEAGEMAGRAARQVEPQGDLFGGHAVVAAQAGDHGEPGRRQLVGDQMQRRAAILQAGGAVAAEAGEPLAHGARADLERGRDGRHAPLLEHAAHHHFSTKRRRAGILMAVHPDAPSAAGDGSHNHLLCFSPDEQPLQSAHLVHRRRQKIQARRAPSQAASELSLNRLNASVH